MVLSDQSIEDGVYKYMQAVVLSQYVIATQMEQKTNKRI